MKCPVCHAKLLPVDGEMFCLQCGQTLRNVAATDQDFLTLEETSDPVLQRAIRDAGDDKTQFKVAAVAAEEPVAVPVVKPASRPKAKVRAVAGKRPSFVSLHAVVMVPRSLSPAGKLVMAPAGAGAASGADMASEEPVAVAAEVPAAAPKVMVGMRPRRKLAARTWIAGLGVLAAAAGFNAWAGNYYSDKIYPGVRVENTNVGGLTFAQLEQRLPQILAQPALAGDLNGRRYALEVGRPAASSGEAVLRQAKEIGRQTPLPGAGVIQSWLAGPVQANYMLSNDAVDRAVAQLAAKVERSPSDAFITTMGSNVLIISDKPGAKLDRAATAAAIKSAYGLVSAVSIKTDKVPAKLTAADLVASKAAAEALIAQPPQLTVGKAKYTPAADQVASWIVFGGAGKGVSFDPAGVAAYVAGLPGKFDRTAAVTALTAGMNPGAAINASTKHVTAAPHPASTAPSRPLASYNYCVQTSSNDAKAAAAEIGNIMGQSGWTLGGRIKYTAVETGCNFELNISDSKAMVTLDPACGTQSTCRIHNTLAINSQQWATPPASWKTGAAAYRAELVGQVIGQWLGFDHPSCTAPATTAPMTEATITIAGCSPQWHAVPAETQDTKVLGGF